MTDLKVIEGGTATPVSPTKATRKKRTSAKRGRVQVGTLDAIHNLILSAQGIELAVMGEGDLSGFDSSAISRLIDMHIADIKDIADTLANGEDELMTRLRIVAGTDVGDDRSPSDGIRQ